MVITISKITDYLLSNERVLWHRKPDPYAPKSKVRVKIIPIIIGATLLILSILFVFPPLLIESIPETNLTYIIFAIDVFGIIVIIPLYYHNSAKGAEYLITNQRVIIYYSPTTKDPLIINLNEVNGQIKMKYNKRKGTGSIYIPSPHWNRYVTPEHIYPDIRNIKDPHKVYDILIEAIATGKSTKWK